MGLIKLLNRRSVFRLAPVRLGLMLWCVWFSSFVLAAPTKELIPYWTKNEPNSVLKIDHSLWDGFLKQYVETKDVSGVNLVRYGEVAQADRDKLDTYLDDLQLLPISQYSKEEQLAFWINLYNALTVQLILDEYPIPSITKIQFGFFSFGPWDEKLLVVEDHHLSLNDIEHRIIRPIWNDPRHHYALNCASIGCPNLLAVAFTPARMEELLDQAAKEFINHYRAVRFERTRLVLSKIFDWYSEDFGGTEAAVIQHISSFARATLKDAILKYQGDIEYDYDWALNEKR